MLNPLSSVLKVGLNILSSRSLIRHKSTVYAMSNSNRGVPLQKVVDALGSLADVKLAASWDNVGLLIEPTEPKLVQHVLFTNDLTEAVMKEAIDLRVDLIISYHPPIFSPLKSITTKTWKERIAAKCLENRIAVYSPHTSFDSIKGGVNDWLASAFDIETSKPIEPGENPENGFGRLCTLKKSVLMDEAVRLVKQHTKLPYVRAARVSGKDILIKTVAVCAGSGATILKGVPADLYLTGEMLHHEILDAIHCDTNVILTNHSDSERGFLNTFATKLVYSLDQSIVTSISVSDEDPLKTV